MVESTVKRESSCIKLNFFILDRMYKLLVFACCLIVPFNGSEISDKAAEFAQTHCVGVTDLTSVDPAYGDLISVFIGSENYIEKVCIAIALHLFIPDILRYYMR